MQMFRYIRLILISCIMIVCQIANAQVIAGYVDDGHQPIAGAAIVVEGGSIGVASDEKGKFSINVGKFPQNIIVSCLGFEEKTIKVEHPTDNLKITLVEKTIVGESVDVIGNKKSDFQHIDASAAVNAVDVGGGIESVVKSQMGVTSNSELSSQYRVRGGNFDENMVYVNNIEIYRPFLIRSGEQEGLSFVNPDLVEQVNFSSGGFDVSYSDKMSSVLDVRYKTPSELHGGGRISLLGASAHFEGSAGHGRYSHITGVRYKTNKYLLGSMDTKGLYDPTFFDVQSLHSLRLGSKVFVDFLGYYASNRYDFKPKDRETSFGTMSDPRTFTVYFEGKEADVYQTGLAGGSVSYAPNDDHSFSFRASLYRSREQENYDVLGEYWLQQAGTDNSIGVGGYLQHARNELFSKIDAYALRGRHNIVKNVLTWEAKLQSEHFSDHTSEWEYRDSAGYVAKTANEQILFDKYQKSDNTLNTKRFSAFVMDNFGCDIANGHLNFTFGLRLSHNNLNSEFLVSPRASLSYQHGKWEHRISGGRYAQIPLFREMKCDDGCVNTGVKSQNSWQVIFGNDLYFKADERPFKLSLEAYYKHITNLNPYSIENVRIRYMAENCGHGYAAGFDAKISGELVEGEESWACLSIMRTAEDIDDDGHGWIPRPSDQRVSFSLFFQDHLPTNKSFGSNLNFIVGSGLPFGPPNSMRYKQTNRMPGYKRVDLGLFKDFGQNRDGSRKWAHVKSARLGIEVFNLFDTANTISYFWVSDVTGGQYAVPNYLTGRRINAKLSIEF